MDKINYLKNFCTKNNIIAFSITSYQSCECCALSFYPQMLGTMEKGIPVQLTGNKKKILETLSGEKISSFLINDLLKNGNVQWGGQWEQPHFADAWDFSQVKRLH